MKIKINENETYEIDLPSEIEIEGFMGVMNRLNKIQKIICKDTSVNELVTIPNHTSKSRVWTKYRKDRPLAVSIVKAHYYKDMPVIEKLINREQYGEPSNNFMSKTIGMFKAWHSITPEEVGLTRFPVRREGRNVSHLHIKQGGTTNEASN